MADQKSGQPTPSVPIVVGCAPGTEQAAELFLAVAEWVLQEEVGLQGPIEGEISDWIAQLWTKPIQFERRHLSGSTDGAIQRKYCENLSQSWLIRATRKKSKSPIC